MMSTDRIPIIPENYLIVVNFLFNDNAYYKESQCVSHDVSNLQATNKVIDTVIIKINTTFLPSIKALFVVLGKTF